MWEIDVRNKCLCVTTCEDYTKARYPSSACNSVRLHRVCSGLVSCPVFVLFFFFRSFRNMRKVTISFIMSVRPSVRTELLVSHPKDFLWIFLYLNIFSKICREIQISSKSNNDNGCFKCGPIYVFHHISLTRFRKESLYHIIYENDQRDATV